MKYRQLILINKLVECYEKGETPTEEIIKDAREAIDREKEILQKKSERSKANLANNYYKWAP